MLILCCGSAALVNVMTVFFLCCEGKKSLYIRLGCRGDWPNIKPPGWDPSSGANPSPATL